LRHRLALFLAGVTEDKSGIALYYRLKTPVDLVAPVGKLRGVTQIGLQLDLEVKWASQIIQVNAKNAIYDYVRRRAKQGNGPNTYSIGNVDWDTATPLDSPPPVLAPLGGTHQPGDIEVMFMRIEGVGTNPSPAPSPEIDALIEPDDLKTETQPVGMQPAP